MLFLIDGHNLIGKMPDLSLQDPADERKLIQRLHLFVQRSGRRVKVVFDPGSAYVPPQRAPYPDVDVAYAKMGNTADRLIAGLVRRTANPRQITVVTSDRELAGQARAAGAMVMTSEEFLRQMEPPAGRPDTDEAEEEERADVRVSKDEVDAWLAEFEQARQARRRRKSPKP